VLDVPTGLRLKVTAGCCVMHTGVVDTLCGEKKLTLHNLSQKDYHGSGYYRR